jgi:hypothetical protein
MLFVVQNLPNCNKTNDICTHYLNITFTNSVKYKKKIKGKILFVHHVLHKFLPSQWSSKKDIEIVAAVLNNRRIWQKYVKLSILKKLFQNKWAIVRRCHVIHSRFHLIPYVRSMAHRKKN